MKKTYTSASDFQICKSRFFHKHVAKDAPFETSPQLEEGKRVHDAFKDMLNAGRVFPDDLKHYEVFALETLKAANLPDMKMLVEQRLGVRANGSPTSFYDDDCEWGGILDLVLMNGTTALLLDWKTGKEREDPFELKIQATLLCAAYPNLQVFKGRYVWLKTRKMGESHDLTDVARTWADMKSIGTLVEQHQRMNYWPEQEGPLCAYCPVVACRFNRTGARLAGK